MRPFAKLCWTLLYHKQWLHTVLVAYIFVDFYDVHKKLITNSIFIFLVLASEIQHKGSNAPHFMSQTVAEETRVVGWQEGHPAS